MDEWIRGFSGELRYEVAGAGLTLVMGWAYKHWGKLARLNPVRISWAYGGAGGGGANVAVLKGVDTDELVGALTAIRHDPPSSAIEELFCGTCGYADIAPVAP